MFIHNRPAAIAQPISMPMMELITTNLISLGMT